MDLGSSLNSDFLSKFIKSMAYVKKSGSICTKPTAPSSTAFDWRKIFKMHLGQIVRCPVKKVEKFFLKSNFKLLSKKKFQKIPIGMHKKNSSLSLSLSLSAFHSLLCKEIGQPRPLVNLFSVFSKKRYNF